MAPQAANAAFAEGEFAAIVGKSGSGKSTLLNLISRIDRAEGRTVSRPTGAKQK